MRITDEAIVAAVFLSDRYISDRFLPDKAIDLIDEAASRVRIKAFTAPPDMKEQQAKLDALNKETEEAVAHVDFEKAAHLRDSKKALQNEMAQRRSEWEHRRNSRVETVGEEDKPHKGDGFYHRLSESLDIIDDIAKERGMIAALTEKACGTVRRKFKQAESS